MDEAEPHDVATAARSAGRIWVLPAQLADQIAAGEVVERPASVVKELVENALDAGAGRVEVDVEGGGRRLIRVIDDGSGMTPDEARLALRRHATSKLRALDDLFTLGTMGFRGEALPSIAAVSRLTLTTRPPGRDAAFRVEVSAGHETDAHEVGAPIGTQLEVRDLLHNVPARLKFLKAEATEAAHITEAVARLALAHPEVHFRLRHGGRVALDLPPHADPSDRVRAVLGRRLGARLAEGAHDEAGVRVRLWLLPPDEAQTTSRGLYLYVGRRFVRDRGLLQAVCMGFGELVPRGRYPGAVVIVDAPEGTVDINVHPQKTEVRFARAQEVYAAVRHGVAALLARSPHLAEGPGHAPGTRALISVASSVPPAAHRVSDVATRYGDAQERTLFGGLGRDEAAAAPRTEAFASPRSTVTPRPRAEDPDWLRAPTDASLPSSPSPAAIAPRVAEPLGFFASLTYLGQLDLTYLVCEGQGELVLVDQHAAHERVAFQRLRDAASARATRTQRLLFPETLALDTREAASAAEHADALAALGYALTATGDAWTLAAAPAELPEAEVVPTLRELLGELADAGGSRALDERLDLALATIACHSVVRAGDALSPAEARALLSSMDGIDFGVHCPHGRPVLLRIGVSELGRRFGRT